MALKLWKTRTTESGLSADALQRLSELERRIEALEKRYEAIDMEWSEWFDKFRRLYARLSKRQEREDRAQAQNEREPKGTVPQITNPAALALLNRMR